MSKLPTLAGITYISQEQQRVIEHLWRMAGLCAGCRKPMSERSPKSAMGIINTQFCLIEKVRNTIGIALYCGACTETMSTLIRQLRPPDEETKNGSNGSG